MKRNTEELPPKDPNKVVSFGPPVVDPAVKNPAAHTYAQDIASRQAGKGLPLYRRPVAGGPTPPIPALVGEHTSGLTMSDQALMQRAAMEGPPEPRTMFQGMPDQTVMRPPGAPPVGILPSDILPEEARRDPEFKEGQGSMYASAQPALAYRYGVIRGGQRLPGQQLAKDTFGAKGGPRPSMTQKNWEDLAAFQKVKNTGESEDARIVQEAAASPAGAAGRFGNSPSDGPVADTKTEKSLTEAVKKLDDFDFNTFREMMMKDILNNEDQRDIIEARCKPLDITDLIVKGYVTQRVPIVPEKFEPEFRSMTGSEDLAIKRLIMQESKTLEVSERYLLDKFSLMGVTLGTLGINGNPLPDHRDQQGKFDENLFWKKFELITSYPFHMLGSLGVNYFWFDIRVRKLFVAKNLKNG